MACARITPSSSILNSELQDYWDQIEALKKDVQLLAKNLSFYQFNWSPLAGQWSIGECLDHLNITGLKTIPAIEALIKQARTRKLFSEGPYHHSRIGTFLFVRLNEPPPKIRVKTWKAYRPTGSRFVSSVLQEFLSVQIQLQALLHASNGLDLAAVKAPSPLTKIINLSLGQWFAFLAAHSRRHVWQARQVAQNISFPIDQD